MKETEFTVVIPCYNEEDGIEMTVDSLRKYLENTGQYEMIIVNDGSTDRTSEILQQLSEREPGILVVNHEKNRGYGAALKTGIRRASGNLIVITDADGTYPNERLPELIEIAKDADMVVGSRTADDVTYPLIRKIPKVFLKAYASWLAGQTIPDMNSGMRVFRRDLAEKFLTILPSGFSFTTTITLAMLTNYYDVRFIPITYHARIGTSKIRPIRDTLNFFQLILRTGMYFAPMRVFLPVVAMLGIGFFVSLGYDILVKNNLTDKTVMLLMFSMTTAIFALLADMIDKRTQR